MKKCCKCKKDKEENEFKDEGGNPTLKTCLPCRLIGRERKARRKARSQSDSYILDEEEESDKEDGHISRPKGDTLVDSLREKERRDWRLANAEKRAEQNYKRAKDAEKRADSVNKCANDLKGRIELIDKRADEAEKRVEQLTQELEVVKNDNLKLLKVKLEKVMVEEKHTPSQRVIQLLEEHKATLHEQLTLTNNEKAKIEHPSIIQEKEISELKRKLIPLVAVDSKAGEGNDTAVQSYNGSNRIIADGTERNCLFVPTRGPRSIEDAHSNPPPPPPHSAGYKTPGHSRVISLLSDDGDFNGVGHTEVPLTSSLKVLEREMGLRQTTSGSNNKRKYEEEDQIDYKPAHRSATASSSGELWAQGIPHKRQAKQSERASGSSSEKNQRSDREISALNSVLRLIAGED